MRTKTSQRKIFEEFDERLYNNMSRDIKSIWIEYFKYLSDDELEAIENEKETPFLDKVIHLLIKDCGYSIEDVYDEYGVSEIKGLLADFAIEGYDHVVIENKQKAAHVNSMNKKLEARIARLEKILLGK